MKAIEANLLNFPKRSPQFVIPVDQRTYSWRCLTLSSGPTPTARESMPAPRSRRSHAGRR
ncbi:MAG: hypothetical protein F4020_00760 [Gammaproteobacteria bacterium]|nr:hypothetical protein [Chloroflexota bacterium]MYK68134.1 hypothetical protein [Gammaproteobacteria bacterium]